MHRQFLVTAILCLIVFAGSAFGEYRTPGNGLVYGLGDLAGPAGDTLEETDYGFILHDKLIISPSDTLEIDGENIWVATRETIEEGTPPFEVIETLLMPCIVVEGEISATNSVIISVTGAQIEDAGHGIIVTGLDHQGAANANIDNCTFASLMKALSVAAGGQATVSNCRFNNSFITPIHAYMSATLAIDTCEFYQSNTLVLSDSLIQITNCRSEGGGVSLAGCSESSQITDCIFAGSDGIGVYTLSEGATKVSGCQFSGFDYGGYACGESDIRLNRNTFWSNRQGALVFDASATPVLRSNRIMGNCVEILTPEGKQYDPAILVMDGASPDFGTQASPGLNVIRWNGPLTFYNASTHDVSAQGNLWDFLKQDAIENLIYHRPDDLSDSDGSGFLSGTVTYEPFAQFSEDPGNADIDWSGRVDYKDLLLMYRDWHTQQP